MEQSIKAYLHCLQEGDLQTILSLFSDNAVVHSPLYGEVSPTTFYADLFKDTSKSTISLLHILKSVSDVAVVAGYFRYDWIIADGNKTSFECVDIFRFDKNNKICELTIIYDTAGIRQSFTQMKQN